MPAEFLPDNPYDTLSEGCDFARNHIPRDIDYATIHLWPDTWLSGGQCSEEAALRFARRWINSHVDCCARLRKPLVLTEFGKKPAGPSRASFYQKVGASVSVMCCPGSQSGGKLQKCQASSELLLGHLRNVNGAHHPFPPACRIPSALNDGQLS